MKKGKTILSRIMSRIANKGETEAKAHETEELAKAREEFEKSKHEMKDFVAFAESVLGERFEEASAKAQRADQTEAAAKRYEEFLKESEIGSASDMDALRIYDFVSRLYMEHAKRAAEELGCKSMWFEKADVLMARLGIIVGSYGLCKNLNDAYVNKTECKFGEEVNRFAKENKLMAELKENLHAALKDAEAMRMVNEFAGVMNERFVKNFRENVRENKDMGWFFENVMNIAYHSADFIAYVAARKDNIVYYPNYWWLTTGFDRNKLDKYVYQDVRYSTNYADLVYEWTERVGVSKTGFIVDKYLIKP